jgi:RND superfamily putative drug exporter
MGRWSANHWKTAVFGWLAFVIVSLGLGMQIGTRYIDENEANVGESRTADKIIDEAGFTVDENGESIEEQSEIVLFQSATLTANDPAFRAAIADVVETLESNPRLSEFKSPLAPAYPDQISKDGHSAMLTFTPEGTEAEAWLYIDDVVATVEKVEAGHAGIAMDSVGLSTGKAVDEEIMGGLAKAGLLSVLLTIVILMFVLRALVGALIPLLLGITSVIATMGLLGFVSQGIPVSENIMEVVLLIGLAVGVDYSLFYMRRERQERAAGNTERASLEAAAATSGRAVLVSGITVLIAMAGMFLSGDKTFMSFSVGTMIVVAVAMVGSLTVLPAVLGRLGDRVERGRVPFLHRFRRPQRQGRMWNAILDRVLRRPALSVILAGGILIALALPTLQLHTAQTGVEGITSPSVEPYKKLIDAFPGTPEPAVVAISADDIRTPEVRHALADLERTALASGEMNPPIDVEVNRDGTTATVGIPLVGNGTDGESTAALKTLRDELLPATLGQIEGVEYAVTGITANSQDFNEAQTSSAPKVFGFVLLFAFGLLLVSFRSIVIALKAIVLNLLSVAAAYGLLVAVFQWGWGEGLLDFESNGGIANWLPIFMFVILFGLSMDYHVFILSRIREAYDRGMSTDEAISHGIKSTAGVVTSAAVVMVAVFAVFMTLPMVDLKQMGLGLAAAVLIDATIVRAVLLPATMKLLGEANWYLPSWLTWLPKLEHERSLEPEAKPAPAAA